MARPTPPLFSKELDELALKYFKTTGTQDEAECREAIGRGMLNIAEAIILAPGISFKVYGENVVLPLLIARFGAAHILNALKDGSINFILWNRDVVRLKNKVAGIDPIASFNLTSLPHCDPQASIELGLRGWGTNLNLPKKVEREIIEHAIAKVSLPSEKVAEDAVMNTKLAYQTGALREYSLVPEVSIQDLEEHNRKKLLDVANLLLEASIISEQHAISNDHTTSWSVLEKIAKASNNHRERVPRAVQSMLELAEIPSIPALLYSGAITPQNIFEIRNRSESIEFRKWLWAQPDPADAQKLTEEYLGSLTTKESANHSKWKKRARFVTFGIIGEMVGKLVEGPAGAGGVAGIAAEMAFDAAQETLMTRLFRRPQPKRFLTMIQEENMKQRIQSSAKNNPT